ncbi:MAG: VCBS repeat-containing protein [Saprospiraceae bacterium]|nr:VCBS repeat-containing protein [Saprospiraceae bacterium]MCF8248778.1 VCBS repeat-containing protein [Saprospiraceae bacterium]MCF8279931.1 VCBS repeat-containing protein [Bacteroidales bacterium]MCF8310063.1 VCBS repeat-containing protein [Saprospiraceae bacterium]MCF8438963.1 VCBS repeat-containing protein [Saprospiraceae bacterium]
MKSSVIFMLMAAACFFSCQNGASDDSQFKLLRKSVTGLDFLNNPVQNGEFNVLSYMYFFNGGGLSAGDFNNDGLVDLYFTSNQGQNKLFLNEGKLKFKDATEQAGLAENYGLPKWQTGASVVDINNDGMLDIYVNGVGNYKNVKGQNELWICQKIENGIPIFEDLAIRYGLDLQGFGTQATFFDYDMDGDLDMYQLNHSLHQNGTFGQRKEFLGKQHPLAGDKLMRNDGDKFTEVTMEAGINSTVVGYGLGVVTGDVNNDGWPDIYIGNDFHENDYLYINQHDGTFKEVLTEAMQHTSRYSMGVDCADTNNDGWDDIISLDMMPEDPFILRSSLGEESYAIFQFKLGFGYNAQFAHNNLQLNLGLEKGQNAASPSNIPNPYFSEISDFAGVFATDWSWAPLFMDFDQDGYKDLFIGNGIPRRMNDIDYTQFMASDEKNKKYQFVDSLESADLAVVERMPRIKLPNKFFKNITPTQKSGGVKFEDIGNQISGSATSYSNGSIYADLDNDGDLDIVTNNIEDEPFVYQNLANEKNKANHNYLKINLKGSAANINAIGARAVVFKKQEKIVYENYAVRGFQSSMIGPLHIGIGDTSTVDSVVLIWPDRSCQRLEGFRYNSTFDIAWKAGLPIFDFRILSEKAASPFQFKDATSQLGLNFLHKENPFVEFNREGLIPQMVSAEGPAIAIGDANGDGLDDVFFGGAKRLPSALFLQTKQGVFIERTPVAILADSLFEDVDATFADLDNDGDQDLIVAAGGNEFRGKDEAMKQRWYRNDGNGNFKRFDFPEVYMTAACATVGDFDKDGLPDIFFGARALPWNYGLTPESVLLRNKGNGEFENISEILAPGLGEVGLVKNATWADLDGNGNLDLLLAMEWGPLTVFYNDGKSLTKSEIRNPKSEIATGWWNFALPYDFDGDGDMDILAGNTGMNGRFHPTESQPVRMYVADFDKNEQVEQLLTFYLGGKETPFANHAEIIKQMPGLKKKFLYAKDFAKASAADLVGPDNLSNAVRLEANEFASMYFENLGGGKFMTHPLPDELQYSSLNAAQLTDIDGDGGMELLLGGNFLECNIEMGRYDANFGNVLSFSKKGEMTVSTLGDQKIDGEVRRIRSLTVNGHPFFVFARNNATAVVLGLEKPKN